ncbi:MAG: serine/threonine-protein kinase [Planctomycetota bacterium]|nr:serine/threonine-protein kinase [Planctomycetota bacterium]
MTTSRSSAKDLFLDAIELEPVEREALLTGLPPELRERVEALLAAHEQVSESTGAGSWLANAAALPNAASMLEEFREDLEPDGSIGPFRLVREIGRGGYGRVWLAEQLEPVRRPVALKMLKVGLDTEEIVKRFRAERQALALMDHASIARIFDGGSTERGLPWFAMEFIDGQPITDYCRDHALDLESRLQLFYATCQAIQHAHQKGVIHRDIKPTNVLVTVVDGQPVPKVIDFGIAKAIEESLTSESLHTLGGQVVGTPAAMSPEQLDHGPDIDTRADIYSLGVLLYELLCDVQPFAGDDGRLPGLDALLDAVRRTDPVLPSVRLREQKGGLRSREVRGDLDWITARCLEKDRERRYSSAALLASDIRRHLEGDTVLAGPPTLGYRLSKLASRYRAALAFASVVVLLLAAGIVVMASQAERAREGERRANVELERYEGIAELLEHALLSLDPREAQGKDPELMLEVLSRAHARVDEQQPSPEVEATVRRVIGGAYMSIARFDEAEPQLVRALELRGQLFGDAHADTLVSLEELGGMHLMAGHATTAMPFLERAYQGRVELLGAEDADTMHALMNVATARLNAGEYEAAAEELLQLEAWYETNLGPKHATTLLVTNNLGLALRRTGDLEGATTRYERLVELQAEVEGPDGPRTLSALNNLGALYMELERPDEARPLLERALEAKQRVLPVGHPSTLATYSTLAQLLESLGDAEGAERLFDEAIEVGTAAHGPDLQHVQVLEMNRAAFYHGQDRHAEALAAMEGLVPRVRATEAEGSRFLEALLQRAETIESAAMQEPAQ